MRAISRRSASGSSGFFSETILKRALLGFVEQVGELHRLAAAGFERLAILAENRAKPDVGELCSYPRLGMPAAKGAKSCWK